MTKTKTAEAKQYHKWLKQQRKLCVVCGSIATDIHHLANKSLSPRRDDLRIIPLCKEHHQGNNGIHTLGLSWYDRFISLDKCVEMSNRLYKEFKEVE